MNMKDEFMKLGTEAYYRGAIDSLEVFTNAFNKTTSLLDITQIDTKLVIEMIQTEVKSYKRRLEELK